MKLRSVSTRRNRVWVLRLEQGSIAMELIPTNNDQNYLDQSRLWERELVDYIDRCQKQSSGEDSLSEIAASLARQELRRCLQARSLVRCHSDLPLAEIVE